MTNVICSLVNLQVAAAANNILAFRPLPFDFIIEDAIILIIQSLVIDRLNFDNGQDLSHQICNTTAITPTDGFTDRSLHAVIS